MSTLRIATIAAVCTVGILLYFAYRSDTQKNPETPEVKRNVAFVGKVYYSFDPRTEVCYASRGNYQTFSMSTVECTEKVLKAVQQDLRNFQ